MEVSIEKKESKTEDLKSMSDSLKMLADEREKEMEPVKLMVKNAIEKGDTKQTRIHARNMVRMRQEVTNYRQISKRLDSMVDYFDNVPEKSTVLSSIPLIIESIDSALATGNSKKMLKTMDQIETQFFTTELVAIFKSLSGTENIPNSLSEDEEISSLIQKVADEYNSQATVENGDKEAQKINEDDVEVKIKTPGCFRLFACWSH
ncbi:hypothetical protein C5167_020140 [Papaver somniferum]|uniref:Uncharacterized protein n=1 Tax=Papaver somniferum TaxID=3469 RepID=A0A4Y7IVA5_PAPSO|nr:charged multivesicular body protein 1b-like [Papaver somniferum]RZC51710.1 hypothetical protein C5167_020140 [Papaver somniferum]